MSVELVMLRVERKAAAVAAARPMSYTFCAGCEIELRQSESYACDCCWRDGMGKSPRVEWKKFSELVDVIPPARNCDYCHRRNFKWLAHATVCNSCYFRDNATFKEDAMNTLKFLRDLRPSPASKEFRGDVTFEVSRRENSPSTRGPVKDGGDEEGGKVGGIGDGELKQLVVVGGREGKGDSEIEMAKRGPIRIQAHRFILASKSAVFRKMFEMEAKETTEAQPRDRQHQLIVEPETNKKEDIESRVFQLEGVAAPILRAAINFLYTAEIHFTDKITPLHVLRFAHDYDIPWLKKVCEIELAKGITTKNLSEMLRLSYRVKADHLKRAARKFFEEHPDDHNDILDALLSSDSED